MAHVVVYGASEKYEHYKTQIDDLENSMIQEFSIDLPHKSENKFSKDYSQAATQLEVKFEIQRKLFYKIEEKYLIIQNDLQKDLLSKDLTSEEASKLKTKIEYATRIILQSRKREITEMYADLKKSLSHCPKLMDVYHQLADLQFNNCSLENIEMNEHTKSLSFDVKKKNKFGSWTVSNFFVNSNDLKSGRLVSRPDITKNVFPFQNFVTQFWTNKNEVASQKFTLRLNPAGEVTAAEFKEESQEPLIKIFGYSFGTQSIKKAFGCNKRKPASKE